MVLIVRRYLYACFFVVVAAIKILNEIKKYHYDIMFQF